MPVVAGDLVCPIKEDGSTPTFLQLTRSMHSDGYPFGYGMIRFIVILRTTNLFGGSIYQK